MPVIVAAVILLGALAALLVRPRGIPDWGATVGGGVLMVLLGLLPAPEALARLVNAWNPFLFFFGLGLASATAERAGVFRAAATLALVAARGSQRRLLVGIFAAGILVTAVLSNDATALLLTPVAFGVATRAGVDPRPYAFACALVANAASFLLPVSNPSNLLVMAAVPLRLDAFASLLLLPSILALTATLAGLLLVYRGQLIESFEPVPTKVRGAPRLWLALGGLACLALAYVAASLAGWPLGLVAAVGALGLLGLDLLAGGGGDLRAIAREVPWALFPLFGGLLLLVGGAEHVGLFLPLTAAVSDLGPSGCAGPLALGAGAAVLSNAINNLPTALVAGSALGPLRDAPNAPALAAGTIVGVNLGPNLTTVGSLATMIWLVLLRRRGLHVSTLAYLRVGGLVTIPALLSAGVGLWLAQRLAGEC